MAILTRGTRGDRQPFVAPGVDVRRAGHAVTFATMPTFQRDVEQGGLGFRPLSADYLAVTDWPEARAALRRSPTAVIRLLRETVLPD